MDIYEKGTQIQCFVKNLRAWPYSALAGVCWMEYMTNRLARFRDHLVCRLARTLRRHCGFATNAAWGEERAIIY
jgi:hypothetical protein